MVEFRPSKPAVRVRSPSPAPFKLNKDYVVIIKEDTPVPIPNTEVKLFSADGTWRQLPGRVRDVAT